jgi:SNF2 family DNA or RNA helicase
MSVTLYKHQQDALNETKQFNKVAYFHDMGLGKTFTGAEKALELGKNILVVCPKSLISTWINHFNKYYDAKVTDLTDKKQYESFLNGDSTSICVINYDLVFRRPELSQLCNFTLLLDESSQIQNEKNKRAKFILKKLNPTNVILLSGTPINGKYEKIWSQCHLLGWDISKETFEKHYCIKDYIYNRRHEKILGPTGFPVKQIVGYKNVERLKNKLREHGAHFLKTEDVFNLPEQVFNEVLIETSSQYKKFIKTSVLITNELELIGDTSLTKMLYARMLCGQYNKNKLETFEDLIESTEDRIIVFYNFNEELEKLKEIVAAHDKPTSEVNGHTKNLENYEDFDNSITFIQYQAGSMGLNLQLANKIIYFTPPLSSEYYEQSKKRIHRIGQNKTCFYYNLICKNSIEEKIYAVLKLRKDYTEELFNEDFKEVK